MSEIYAPAMVGLGDIWAAVNYCLRLSMKRGQPITMSIQRHHWKHERWYFGKITEIANLFDSGGSIEETDGTPSHIIHNEIIWWTPYLPAKKRWSANNSKVICYCFNATTMAEYIQITPEQLLQLEEKVHRLGYQMIEIGPYVPLKEVAKMLANAEYYVGPSSGIMHIAHSVGVPSFLIQGTCELGYCIKHHVGKSYTLCQNYDDFATQLELEIICKSK